eukprot:UN05558
MPYQSSNKLHNPKYLEKGRKIKVCIINMTSKKTLFSVGHRPVFCENDHEWKRISGKVRLHQMKGAPGLKKN